MRNFQNKIPCLLRDLYVHVFESLGINNFFKLGFTPCKAEQTLRGMELQEKEAQKD